MVGSSDNACGGDTEIPLTPPNLDGVKDESSDQKNPARKNLSRLLGLGLITGAADEDCSPIGTYASAGNLPHRKQVLHAKPEEAKKFYLTITAFTILAVGMNLFGFNPMKALVFAGVCRDSRRRRCCC